MNDKYRTWIDCHGLDQRDMLKMSCEGVAKRSYRLKVRFEAVGGYGRVMPDVDRRGK